MMNFLLHRKYIKLIEEKNKKLEKENDSLNCRIKILGRKLEEASRLLDFKEDFLSSMHFNPNRGYEPSMRMYEIVGDENLSKEEAKILKNIILEKFNYLWIRISKSPRNKRLFEIKYNYKDSPSVMTEIDFENEEYVRLCLKEAVIELDKAIARGA